MAKEPSKPAPARTLYTLSEAVTFNGETVIEIDYRKPTARDMRKWFNSQGKPLGDRYSAFLADVCEKPAAFFDEIPAADYLALTDIVDGFFKRPASAETSTA